MVTEAERMEEAINIIGHCYAVIDAYVMGISVYEIAGDVAQLIPRIRKFLPCYDEDGN